MIRKSKEKPFTRELRLLNAKISKILLTGEKKHLQHNDLRNVYDHWHGRCAYCGLPLTTVRYKLQSVHFAFRIPLEVGGLLSKDNIFPLCKRCCDEKKPRRPPSCPVFDYNAFSDLIVQLVSAIILKDKERINYFKVQIDLALSDFVNTLFYKPMAMPEKPVFRLENKNCFSDTLVALSKEIEKILKEIEITKQYEIMRKS